MKQVWKFILYGNDEATRMPSGAEVLTVAFQGENVALWALVDTEAFEVNRHFIIRGTGHNVRLDNTSYIGTAFTGPLVFHVFELI